MRTAGCWSPGPTVPSTNRIPVSHLQGFHRRILQLHLCLIYFLGGITKCAGAGWYDGTSIWYALIRPPFNLLPPETLIAWKNVFLVLSISVCFLETGYPLFIWFRKTRMRRSVDFDRSTVDGTTPL